MKDNQVTGDGQDVCLATLVLFLAPLIGVDDKEDMLPLLSWHSRGVLLLPRAL